MAKKVEDPAAPRPGDLWLLREVDLDVAPCGIRTSMWVAVAGPGGGVLLRDVHCWDSWQRHAELLRVGELELAFRLEVA